MRFLILSADGGDRRSLWLESKKEELGIKNGEGGPGEEAVDDAVVGEGGEAGGVGEAGGGDELMKRVGAAGIATKPVIAELGLDKLDPAFAEQPFSAGKDVGL